MTREKWIGAVCKAFADECAEDFVGLWAILWKVRRLRPRLSSEEARRATLDIVRKLLAAEHIIVGYPTSSGSFVRWSGSRDEAIQRIELEWAALGREPDVGDIVWFVRGDAANIVEQHAPPT